MSLLMVFSAVILAAGPAQGATYGDLDVTGPTPVVCQSETWVVNGYIRVHSGGNLTIDNCVIEMAAAGMSDLIQVDAGGVLNVWNGSTLTVNPADPGYYRLSIEGGFNLGSSVVEYMYDDPGSEVDGVELYNPSAVLRSSTIRNGLGTGIYIAAQTVTFTGLNIQNNGGSGVYVDGSAGGSVALDGGAVTGNTGRGIWLAGSNGDSVGNMNIASNGQFGIYAQGASNATLDGNTVYNHVSAGIQLYQSSVNTISGGEIWGNYMGVYIDTSDTNNLQGVWTHTNTMTGIYLTGADYNTISGATSGQNTHGMVLEGSSWNTLTSSTASSNADTGINVTGGHNNTLFATTTSGNGNNGIGMYFSTANTLSDISSSTNNAHGIFMASTSESNVEGGTVSYNTYGVELHGSDSNTFTGFNVLQNMDMGLILSGGSDGNSIQGSIIQYNGGGQLFEGGIYLSQSSQNTITDNYLSYNQKYGIYLDYFSDNNVIRDNDLISNKWGAYVVNGPVGNLFYHNNFDNTHRNAHDQGTSTAWDNGYPSGGNWWSDLAGRTKKVIDQNHGFNQDKSGADGINDNPYKVTQSGTALDDYPYTYSSGWLTMTLTVHNQDTDTWYTMIQSAVNAAGSGHSLKAYERTYYENVHIDKMLTLTGEGPDATVISGSGLDAVINLTTANGIILRDLGVRNGKYGVRMSDPASGAHTLDNLKVEYNDEDGIYIEGSDQNTLLGITSYYNGGTGVRTYQSDWNSLQSSWISYNGHWGIYLAYSHNNTMTDTIILDNAIDGIWLQFSDYNKIEWVASTDHETSRGITLEYSSHNELSNITVVRNNQYGIFLGADSNHNIFSDVTTNENLYGIYVIMSSNNSFRRISASGNLHGMHIYALNPTPKTENNVIESCNMSNNEVTGIWLYGVLGGHLAGNTVKSCTLNGNGDGIRMLTQTTFPFAGWVHGNTITGNTFMNNANAGIMMESQGNRLYENTIDNNTFSGNSVGIFMKKSYRNKVFNNTIAGNDKGVHLDMDADDNTFHSNLLEQNTAYGVYIPYYASPSGPVDNSFFHNDFDNPGAVNAYDGNMGLNNWDDGHPSGGNWWSDADDAHLGGAGRAGIDSTSGAKVNFTDPQPDPAGDGILDWSYDLDASGYDYGDWYPSTSRWTY